MRASDVVALLQEELPKRTDLFSSSVSVISLTRSGSTVTADAATPHGRATGDYVVVKGAVELNPITSLTFADGVATAVTQNDHRLTEPPDNVRKFGGFYDFHYSDVSGADQSEYNIREVVLTVPNRKTFTYPVSGTPASPATGSPAIRQDGGWNGRFEITVIDPTTFTYQITTTPVSPAAGTIEAKTGLRMTSAVSGERAGRSYTEHVKGQYWLFVVLSDVSVSKNRSILGDASTENAAQNVFRERLIEPFSVFVFAPARDSYSGREFQDGMEDVRGYIYNSMVGYIFESAVSEAPFSKTSPLGDRYAEELADDSTYVHQFMFERVIDVTYPDTIGPPDSVPLRDVSLDQGFVQGTEELEAEIDLDEQPL